MTEYPRIKSIDDFVVYQKAVKVFDAFTDEDLPILSENFASRELAKNQIRCLDSICANMEEGYARKSGKELKHFFRMSRGSTGESKGRYKRLRKFLPAEIIKKRVSQLDEIQAMLHSLISKLSD